MTDMAHAYRVQNPKLKRSKRRRRRERQGHAVGTTRPTPPACSSTHQSDHIQTSKEGGHSMKTSAPGWARHRTNTPAPLWSALGYSKKWTWQVDRATCALLKMSTDGSIGRIGPGKRYWWPGQHDPMDLFELATSYPILKRAIDLTHIRGGAPGPDGVTHYPAFQTPDAYDRRLADLRIAIRTGEYKPGDLRRVETVNGRVLHIPDYVDRIVARAVGLVLTPIFEPYFHEHSYGFRRGISTHHAIAELGRLCTGHNRWVLRRLDLSKAFDRCPHDNMLGIIGRRVRDERYMALVADFVRRSSWRNLDGKTNVGLPMGDPLSPLAFNIYLDHVLDRVLARNHPDIVWLRYADDVVLICETERQAAEHTDICERILRPAGLVLNHEKSSMADLKAGERIEYLGYEVRRNRNGEIALGIAESTYHDLPEQILQDIGVRSPITTSPFTAKGQAITRLIQLRLAGWLEAYAPAITTGELGTLRKRLRQTFQVLKDGLDRDQHARDLGVELVKWPSGKDIADLWARGRAWWDGRKDAPVPDVRTRLTIRQRSATASENASPGETGDIITDAGDLVPAPSARTQPYIKGSRSSEAEEWRVGLISPPHGDGGSAGDAYCIEHGPPNTTVAFITVDGGSRGNPGPAACAAVVVEHGGNVIRTEARALAQASTSIVAEYHAVLLGLELAETMGLTDVEIRSDSWAVVDQLLGVVAVQHRGLKAMKDSAHKAADRIVGAGGSVRITHVSRALVQAADELVNRALDELAA